MRSLVIASLIFIFGLGNDFLIKDFVRIKSNKPMINRIIPTAPNIRYVNTASIIFLD